ncbi:MAG: hypothetical protein J1E80_01540 [Desulfovibrionaceae bacterium]|nr:hypothetical protein [Desulfovibrionaceae bacterium]
MENFVRLPDPGRHFGISDYKMIAIFRDIQYASPVDGYSLNMAKRILFFARMTKVPVTGTKD